MKVLQLNSAYRGYQDEVFSSKRCKAVPALREYQACYKLFYSTCTRTHVVLRTKIDTGARCVLDIRAIDGYASPCIVA
jgi:hypothetical protein